MPYSTQTTVGELLDNDATRAVLEKFLPGIANHPSIGVARGMSLASIAPYSGGLITDDALAKIDGELQKIGT